MEKYSTNCRFTEEQHSLSGFLLVITNWYESLAFFRFIHFTVFPLNFYFVFCVGVQLYLHA